MAWFDPAGMLCKLGSYLRHHHSRAYCSMGAGRSGNMWLSPEGCLMFSVPLKLTSSSTLNPCISILQHVAATSVVHAVRARRGYEVLAHWCLVCVCVCVHACLCLLVPV